MPRVSLKCNKPIIGLTGSVGAGKSTVANILESLGAAVIDSDQLSHEQLRDSEVIATLRRWWGPSVLTPEWQVDRKAVAAIVFDDPHKLSQLQGLLYPRIRRRREELLAIHNADPNVQAVVFDTPKLFEVGLDKDCDAVIFVDAEARLRLQRLALSRGWDEAELLRREKLLQPLDKKRANADYVVVNNSRVEDLRSEVEGVFQNVLASFCVAHSKRIPDSN